MCKETSTHADRQGQRQRQTGTKTETEKERGRQGQRHSERHRTSERDVKRQAFKRQKDEEIEAYIRSLTKRKI